MPIYFEIFNSSFHIKGMLSSAALFRSENENLDYANIWWFDYFTKLPKYYFLLERNVNTFTWQDYLQLP